MNCEHCKQEISNDLVVMPDDSVYCYTCGRLKAEQDSRQLNLFYKTQDEFDRRRNLYAKKED